MIFEFLFYLGIGALIAPFYRNYLIPNNHRGERFSSTSRGNKFYIYYHDRRTYKSDEEFIHAERKLTIKAIKFSCALMLIIFIVSNI